MLASRLSNAEFRAYRRKDSTFILRLRSLLLISTRITFGDTYLTGMTGSLLLQTGEQLDIDDIALGSDLALPFDGATMALQTWLAVPTGLQHLSAGLAQIDFRVGWAIAGAPFEARVRDTVVVRTIRSALPYGAS